MSDTEMRDLRGFDQSEAETGITGKIAGAVVVIALALGAAGIYAYETGASNSPPKQMVASADLPSPALAPRIVPPPPIVVPPTAPAETMPAPTVPQATAAPKVRTARMRAPAQAPLQSTIVQPSETLSTQPAPADSNVVAPAMTPTQDAPVPAQPVPAPAPQS